MALPLAPAVILKAGELHRQFIAAKPFHYVLIEDFLDSGFCQELIAEFPSFDPARATNERGETGRKAVVSEPARLGPAYARFDRMLQDPEFLELMSRITGIPKLLYDPEFVGGGTHENLDG